MRILIISDSHGNTEDLLYVVKNVDYDKIFFLGDGIKDILTIEGLDRSKLLLVKGNNDISNIVPDFIVEEIEGKKFFITHGHLYNVKYGIKKLVEVAQSYGADVIVYGHTHIALQTKIQNKIICINPGSIGRGKLSQNTFAIVDIDKEKNIFSCSICKIS